jgi:hypothetical protein
VTPAYAVEVRHSADHAQQQATQPQIEDAEKLARDALRVLPQVVAVLPADEVRSHLSQLGPLPGVDSPSREAVCVFC